MCWVATDEPGYPCIAQRWTGSDAARCVPQPRDAASLLPEPLLSAAPPQFIRIDCSVRSDRDRPEPPAAWPLVITGYIGGFPLTVATSADRMTHDCSLVIVSFLSHSPFSRQEEFPELHKRS